MFDPKSIVCVTPLYHFSCDTDELALDRSARIVRSNSITLATADSILLHHLEIGDPPYLLWQTPILSGWLDINEFSALAERQDCAGLTGHFIQPAVRWFHTLRLFKPGRLRAGESCLLLRDDAEGKQFWCTLGSWRCSGQLFDYSLLEQHLVSYSLSSLELPFLNAFGTNIGSFLSDPEAYPNITLGIELYAQEWSSRLDLLNAITALETLLIQESENELGYRLALRTANLLGTDAASRSETFAQIKKFYNLRSRIVHGSNKLKQRDIELFGELDSLRELVRRVILSIMAIVDNRFLGSQVYTLLDDIALDEEKRREIQKVASRFLHMSIEASSALERD